MIWWWSSSRDITCHLCWYLLLLLQLLWGLIWYFFTDWRFWFQKCICLAGDCVLSRSWFSTFCWLRVTRENISNFKWGGSASSKDHIKTKSTPWNSTRDPLIMSLILLLSTKKPTSGNGVLRNHLKRYQVHRERIASPTCDSLCKKRPYKTYQNQIKEGKNHGKKKSNEKL